ncbi:MAG: M56 family metallopeptidase [Planctomycetaceae bacterium]|jgi:beta-lactamase regulating signal transducer with metallopeptidase domain|nr:M56 family metallopeptidase [Planctomycetaceae bacterium]
MFSQRFVRRSAAETFPLFDEVRQTFRISYPIRFEWAEDAPVPFTCCFWKPVIIFPSEAKNWSNEKLRAVLLHELAHIVRRDILWQNLARIAGALYWFHPLLT